MIKKAVVLVGFMGAGKSQAARAIANQLNVESIDSDELLEKRFGCSIDEWFTNNGEVSFREHEETVVCELLSRQSQPTVVSLGGGAIISERVRNELSHHTVVLCDIDAETAWDRVSNRRPLAEDQDTFKTLFEQRVHLYNQVADAIVPAFTEAVEASLPAITLLQDAPDNTKLLWAHSHPNGYPVYLGNGLIDSNFWPIPGRRFLIADDNVGPLIAKEKLADQFTAELHTKSGETNKSLSKAEEVLSNLAKAGMTRDDHIVALGGGVVGDVGGFCAAVYQRGVGVVHIPTTLVAQVDSAYGGKTGVNLPEGKNYVGAYHNPVAVLVDPALLTSLPEGELAAGWAEVIKTGLITGGSLWEEIRNWLTSPLTSSGSTIPPSSPAESDAASSLPTLIPTLDLICACARRKLAIVAADQHDDHERQLLNFGHTVGHAIEAATDYRRYRHGEAVALGMLAALSLSDLPDLRSEVSELLKSVGLPTNLDSNINLPAITTAVQRDKKRRSARVGFVLLEAPGQPRIGVEVEERQLVSVLEALQG